jgi:hypothetical protein
MVTAPGTFLPGLRSRETDGVKFQTPSGGRGGFELAAELLLLASALKSLFRVLRFA